MEVLETVVSGDGGDLANEGEDGGDVVGDVQGLQVDVSGGAAHVEGSEQDAALEDELAVEPGGAEPGEEPFQDLEGRQFDLLAPDVEGVDRELVPGDRQVHLRGASASGHSDVDAARDVVDEVVSRYWAGWSYRVILAS